MINKRPNLLTPGASQNKLAKGSKGIEAAVLHLAPADLAGFGSVCPWASAGCKAACLNTSGRAQTRLELDDRAGLLAHPIHGARIRRTERFFTDRTLFFADLDRELTNLANRAKRKGRVPVVRLNGTSDIPWERRRYHLPQEEYYGFRARSIIERHPEIQFYDYTKSKYRALSDLPANYHLTLSRTEADTDSDVLAVLDRGVNVAVVFGGPELPGWFGDREVIDGTKDDWRFKDPAGVIVGLLALGRAKRDRSGFVIHDLDN